jgi:hypothetical protein
MLNFVDITKERPFQVKEGTPFITFGLQNALKNKPLDFFYESSSTVSTFEAKKVNSQGVVTETISLSTSLVTSNGITHVCTGLVDYASDLETGIYYFEVNGQYWSDYFCVDDSLVNGTSNQGRIDVSGLNFFDTNYTISWRKKIGSPDILFGLPIFDNDKPPAFRYLATDAISTFKFIKINTLGTIIEEVSLDSSLVASDGTYHTCNGLIGYTSNYMFPALGYFEVNSRYESALLKIAETSNSGIGYDIIGTTLIVY